MNRCVESCSQQHRNSVPFSRIWSTETGNKIEKERQKSDERQTRASQKRKKRKKSDKRLFSFLFYLFCTHCNAYGMIFRYVLYLCIMQRKRRRGEKSLFSSSVSLIRSIESLIYADEQKTQSVFLLLLVIIGNCRRHLLYFL